MLKRELLRGFRFEEFIKRVIAFKTVHTDKYIVGVVLCPDWLISLPGTAD